MLLLALKRQDCVQISVLLKNCAIYCLDPEGGAGAGIGTETFPNSEQQ